MQRYFTRVADNHIFVAGVALLAVVVAACGLSRLFKRLLCAVNDYLNVSIRITSQDRTVGYFYRWLDANGSLRWLNNVDTTLAYKGGNENNGGDGDDDDDEEGNDDTVIRNVPRLGVSYIKHKGKEIRIEKTEHINMYGGVTEIINLSCSGVKRQFLEDIIEASRVLCETRPANKLVIYKGSCGEWQQITCRNRRSLKSVILDEGIAESLMADLKEFLKSKTWYEDRGVPHRRGYLLYGPPGCGKTSMIKALASECEYAVCILNIRAKQMNDDTLSELFNSLPAKSFVLLEDVDAAFKSREVVENEPNLVEESNNQVTFSGLLNAIDGVASSEGRILFMTTNHIKKLDPALIRPGRVDRKQLIDYPSKSQLKSVFKLFYPEADDILSDLFVKKCALEDKKRSVAEIQGHFMMYKNDPQKAIDMYQEGNGEIIEL